MSNNISIKKFDSKINEFLNDKYISSSIVLFFGLYSFLIAPKLPERITSKLDCNLINLMITVIIFYLASKNCLIGFAGSFAYLMTLNTAQTHKINNELTMNQYKDAISQGEKVAQILLPNTNKIPKCGLSSIVNVESDNSTKGSDSTPELTQEQLMKLIMLNQQQNAGDQKLVKEQFDETSDHINNNMLNRIFMDRSKMVDLSTNIEGYNSNKYSYIDDKSNFV